MFCISDAQIYMDHHNYMINDITAVQIFTTENPVNIYKYGRKL